MSFQILDKLPDNYRGMWITTYLPISGHKAVQYWWNPEGFWEPYQTGMCGYETQKQAEYEGLEWAEDENIPFVKEKP